jgi:hypothetical protein
MSPRWLLAMLVLLVCAVGGGAFLIGQYFGRHAHSTANSEMQLAGGIRPTNLTSIASRKPLNTLNYRMGSTWSQSINRVDKNVSLSIPLINLDENEQGVMISLGCSWGSLANIYFKLGFFKGYRGALYNPTVAHFWEENREAATDLAAQWVKSDAADVLIAEAYKKDGLNGNDLYTIRGVLRRIHRDQSFKLQVHGWHINVAGADPSLPASEDALDRTVAFCLDNI